MCNVLGYLLAFTVIQGLVCLIVPIPALGITSRLQAAAVVAAATFLAILLSATCSP